jgi:predicted AAA+ superfamily ATPase
VIHRIQLQEAKSYLLKNKALIIFGPRQVGKTTLVNLLLEGQKESILHLNGDNYDTRELLSKPNVSELKSIIGNTKILFIDEAQRISEVGLLIKIIVDQIKTVQVIATGSSAFDLAGKINEPLTGRKFEILLLPFSHTELVKDFGLLEEKRALEQRLIFGSYPEIVTSQQKTKLLKLLTDSYLYKDLFELEQLKKPILLQKLVKALALQVGSEVNANELGKLVGASSKTVEKYLTLLESAFVIFTLSSYSNNARNELKKSRKIYFYDNGILNAIVNNFNPLQNRTNVGSLWENYLLSERRKLLNIQEIDAEMYFWRTTQQQEVDYVEIHFDKILAFEFKWNEKQKARFSKTFTKAYPTAETTVIHKENYMEFLREV